jgi:hypothetical protein
MSASYDEAVAELYRAPHDAFVAERKRLATELKAAGDKAGAARLLKLGRPTLSAWAVNQLWWQARDLFDGLLAAGARLRVGDQAATAERRDAIAALKSRAAALLVDGGHAVNEATLRRVTTTLAALAATGGFEPDAPGALAADRDPPGFDAAGFGVASGATNAAAPRPNPPAAPAPAPGQSASPTGAGAPLRPAPTVKPPLPPASSSTASPASARPMGPAAVTPSPARAVETPLSPEQRAELERAQKERAERDQAERARAEAERIERERAESEEAERRRAEQEQRRLELERVERRAERQRLITNLPSLQSDLERRQREVERLRAELLRVEGLAEQARAAIEIARKRLATLGEEEDIG